MTSTDTPAGFSKDGSIVGWAHRFSFLLVLVAYSFVGVGYGGQRFRVRKMAKAGGPKFVPGEVLVKFKAGVSKASIAAVHRRHGTSTTYTSPFAKFKRVRIPKGKTVAQMVAALRKEPSVEYAVPNSICHAFLVPNDTFYPDQWHLDDSSDPNPNGGANGGGINVEPAWDVTRGAGVVVAVLDTGVAYENYVDPVSGKTFVQAPDLAATTFVPGFDFIANDTHPNDENSHGTHVTGTIAQSTNNNLGVAGVAFECSIMPVRVLDENGSGTAQSLADGLHFAADNGAKVINMSLGWPVNGKNAFNPGPVVENAVAYAYNKGVTIVCASGNDRARAVAYPAAYDDYCIAVGATRYDETRPRYSNRGDSLDIAAPGGDTSVDQNDDGFADGVLQNTFETDPGDLTDFAYWFFQGTSMATPHVAGVAALVISNGITGPDAVRQALESTAEDKGSPGWDSSYGHGIVDALAAVLVAGPPSQRPDAADDSDTIDEDTAATISVLANDTDPDSGPQPLTVTNLTQPANGTAVLNPNGTVTYTPFADFNGEDSFTYTAHDGTWHSIPATVTITVDPVNDAPVALRDAYGVVEDGDLGAAAPGVLANDVDVDGDGLTASLVSDVGHGTLALSPSGSFTYTPDPGFIGGDSFTYEANDGTEDSNVVTVTIAVGPAYRIPDAELLSQDLEVLSWSDSGSTLDNRIDVSGEGVELWMTLDEDLQSEGKIALGDPWPLGANTGFGWDDVLSHWTSLNAYVRYEIVVSYVNGPVGSSIDVNLFLNTGLTGPSGFPSDDPTNDTFWEGNWATLALGETKTLVLDFDSAKADNITDNKVPHTEGGLESPDLEWYAINERDRNEVDNIGFQIADFDGDARGAIEVTINTPVPTAALVRSKRGYSEEGRAVLEWETASETGTVGFYVLRRDGASGPYKKIGRGMLPGLLHSPQGGEYRLVDPDVQLAKTYTYELVEVEVGGRKRSHGPIRVTVQEQGGGRRTSAEGEPTRGPDSWSYSRVARRRPTPSVRRARSAVQIAANEGLNARPDARFALKIAVREDGLYYVSASEIALLLGRPATSIEDLIRRGWLSLSCQGKSVAYLPAQQGAGLYFYGQGIDSIYTDDNIYWLERGHGVLMDEAGESGAEPVTGQATFVDTAHAEENALSAIGLFRDPEADFWLWNYVVSGQASMNEKSFPVRADGAARLGTATMIVRLKGATNTRVEPDHHARISVNGTAVGEGRWDGIKSHTLELTFNGGLLRAGGANTVSVEGVLDTGAPYSIFYVDSFDLTYQRRYEAVGDGLLCRAEFNPVLTIAGFSQPTILVLDVTEPRKPTHVVATTVDEHPDGGFRVTFASPWPDSVYLAVTPAAAKRPASLTADVPSQLKWRGNHAAYVVVAPAALKNAAQSLAAYRQGQGLTAMVADLEDIYDEFNHGIASPKAVRSFLSHARRAWRRRPQYVALAGNGTYDYKDYRGYGDNLVPPLLMGTPYGLFASDAQFAPEVAIGRLPAATSGELGALVAKIIAYEQSGGEWTKRVLMAADDPDGGGNFPRDSDELATLVPTRYSVSKVYLSETTVGVARQRLLAGINAGAVLVNYIGHGGPDRLAHEGLLTIDDAGALSNGDRLPVVTTLTCAAGRLSIPGFDCLGEALVKQPNGGAIAFWGPSGLLFNRQSMVLGQGFFRAVLESEETVLGDAIVEAFRNYGAGGGELGAVQLYNLLGDPGLRVRPGR